MTENTSAQLSVDGKTVELARENSVVGNDGLNIGPLLKDTGLVTYDPVSYTHLTLPTKA